MRVTSRLAVQLTTQDFRNIGSKTKNIKIGMEIKANVQSALLKLTFWQ